jgi:membrane protease YdiL (CAAX protease family)
LSGRVPEPHNRRALFRLILVLAILLVCDAVGLYNGQKYGSLYIFGYIIAIVVGFGGLISGRRAWSEAGIKRGFIGDFKRVVPLFAVVALVFQLLPPPLGVSYVFGFYSEEVAHITGRLALTFGTVAVLIGLAVILTFLEEAVFRVTIQERLSWFIGTPAAVVFASLLFGVAHEIATSGSLPVVLTDYGGVVLDGLFFGAIYARTHNLAVVWATHLTADIVGIITLFVIL